MTEALLQYLWKMKLFHLENLTTTEGEKITIIQGGEQNHHAGPDFTNAKIKIDKTIWAGNIEIHLKSSGWKLHQHHTDDAYQNVILHVVFDHDEAHSQIPVLELKNRIDQTLLDKYSLLMKSTMWIPCAKNLSLVKPIIIKDQMIKMLAERMEEKALAFEQRLIQNKNDWEETCYQLIARSFGTNVNADPFERVAQQLPFHLLRKHANQLLQIESLLFGQAGFLHQPFKEIYPHKLKSEYDYLAKKYSLDSMRKLEWKFLRMRPANFPTIRLSQFAQFISQHDKIFQSMLQLNTLKDFYAFFQCEASVYWREHYSFKKASPVKSTQLGKKTIDLILINTILPLIYLYGKISDSEKFVQRAISLMEKIPSEKNTITENFMQLKIKSENAADSQGLLFLKKNYCQFKLCLSCGIGNAILNSIIPQSKLGE